MAIVTNIDQLSRYCNNQVVLDYVQRIGNDSADRMRILELALGSFEKFYFSFQLRVLLSAVIPFFVYHLPPLIHGIIFL